MGVLFNRRNLFFSMLLIVFCLAVSSALYSHCQIPCGIYNDAMRFDMMSEHIQTIEKSMKSIIELSNTPKPDNNQLVRWINNKDDHADQLGHIITYYFLAQRVTPVDDKTNPGYNSYVHELTLLHNMLVLTMKSKQGTDLGLTGRLGELVAEYKKVYFEYHAKENKK